jgi:phage tail-like protein
MATDHGEIYIQHEGVIVRTVRLTADVIKIGRRPDHAICLADQQVSSDHAELRADPPTGTLMLTDTRSRNGTYLAGRCIPADEPMEVPDGSVIDIGPFRLLYRAPQVAQSAPAREQAQTPAPGEAPEAPQPSWEERIAGAEQALKEISPVPEPDLAVTEPMPTNLPRIVKRDTYPLPLPPCGRSSYVQFLPVIFHEESFMGRFLQIFETLWEPREQREDHIHMYFDPFTCPASFLPWMASWLDVSFNVHWPEARRRRFVAQATTLYRWRGTADGIKRLIEVCTELYDVEVRKDPAEPFVFRVSVSIPRGSDVTQEVLDELIQLHKPAASQYVLEIKRE